MFKVTVKTKERHYPKSFIVSCELWTLLARGSPNKSVNSYLSNMDHNGIQFFMFLSFHYCSFWTFACLKSDMFIFYFYFTTDLYRMSKCHLPAFQVDLKYPPEWIIVFNDNWVEILSLNLTKLKQVSLWIFEK